MLEEMKWTQADLAKKAGVKQPVVSKWKAGTITPDLQSLQLLHLNTGISLSWLTGGPETGPLAEALKAAAPTPQAVTQLAEKLITRVQKGLITEQTVKSIRALGDILDDLVTAQGGEEQEDEPEERQRP